MNQQEAIVQYYDDCQVDYHLLWHLSSHMSMHYGLWERGIYTLRQALTRLNQTLADGAGILPGDHVLDAGCGVGGSSIYLARVRCAEVTGITLSQKQVETCESNARARHCEGSTRFLTRDYTATGFPDESFDVVWAVESVCHAQDKQTFLNEAFRLLKPGGRLCVADFFQHEGPKSSSEEDLLQRWASGWAVPFFSELNTFCFQAADAGFNHIDPQDLTQKIRPSSRRLFLCSYPGTLCSSLLERLNLRNAVQGRNAQAAREQYLALKKNLWRYAVVYARKPDKKR